MVNEQRMMAEINRRRKRFPRRGNEPMQHAAVMPPAGGGFDDRGISHPAPRARGGGSRAEEIRKAIADQRRRAGGTAPTPPQTPDIENVYLSPERRAASKARFMAAMTPQVTQGINRVTSAVDPRMKGKLGASLQQQVFSPMQQALAGFELGQEQKGTDYAAGLPFKIADYTGRLGGVETLRGRGMDLQEEIGLGRLDIERDKAKRAETKFGWEEEEQEALENIAAETGLSLQQLELLAQTDPDKYNRLLQKQMGLLNVPI